MSEPDLVLDVALAPAAVLAKVEAAIGRRKRRLFGLFKTQNEYVGVVGDERFAIWERQQRVVRVVGTVRPVRGGTRVELRFVIPATTRVLALVGLALYLFAAVGFASLPPDVALSGVDLFAIVAGGLLLVVGGLYFARRQREDLVRFLSGLLADPPSG